LLFPFAASAVDFVQHGLRPSRPDYPLSLRQGYQRHCV